MVTGDFHFSQGDGEITFCGAIEMGGWIDFHVDLIKDGLNKYGITQAMFQPGPVEPRYSDFLVFEGISVDDEGKQHYNDVTIAYRRACLNAINYLKKFGYSGEQVYTILSTRAGGRPREWCRRHPERLRVALHSNGDLRLRYTSECARADEESGSWLARVLTSTRGDAFRGPFPRRTDRCQSTTTTVPNAALSSRVAR